MNPENDKKDDADSSAPADSSATSTDNTTSETGSASSETASSVTTKSSDSSSSSEDSGSKTDTTSAEVAGSPSSESTHASTVTDTKKTLQLEAAAGPGGRREDRRSLMQNVNMTLDYIGTISRDKKLHFRASDQLTSRLLIGSFVLALGFATLPFFEMNAIAAFAYLLADVMLFSAISVFVISRFGIIRAMEPRHALVCWHLMVGTGLLALVIGFNVVAAVVLFMMRERLMGLFPGG